MATQTQKNLQALKQLVSKMPAVGKKAIIDKIDSILPKSTWSWQASTTAAADAAVAAWVDALLSDKKQKQKEQGKVEKILWPDSIYSQTQSKISDKLTWMDKNPTPKKNEASKILWAMNPTRENARDTAVMNAVNSNIKQVPEWIDIDEKANKEYQAEKIRENYMNDMKKREQKEYWKHIPEKLKLIQDMADSISDEEKILLDQFLEELIESYYMQKVEEKKNSGLYV